MLSSGICIHHSTKLQFFRSFQDCETKIENKSAIEKRPMAVWGLKIGHQKTLNSVEYYLDLRILYNTLIECNIFGICACVTWGRKIKWVWIETTYCILKISINRVFIVVFKSAVTSTVQSENWETVENLDNFGILKLDWGILDEEIEWTSL